MSLRNVTLCPKTVLSDHFVHSNDAFPNELFEEDKDNVRT